MQLKKLLLVFVSVILLLGIVLVGCNSNKTTTSAAPQTTTTSAAPQTSKTTTAATTTATTVTPKRGGSLKFADPATPTGGNIGWPLDTTGFTTALNGDIFFEPILELDNKGVIKPKLATKWDISPDLKTITLTLRQGVKFHDGSDWNATVAKWNMDQLIAAKLSDYVNISSVDIVDNYTVKLNVINYTNTILATLASSRMVSQQAYISHGANQAAIDWMKANPVGTGPFKFVSFTPNVSLKGARFDGYWQPGKPYLDTIEEDWITDVMTRSAALESGEVDMIGGDLSNVEYNLQQKGYQVIKGYLGPFCLVPDSKNADSPFSKLQVRQALDYAIDRDSIVKALGYGFWIPTYEFGIPGTPSYVNITSPRSYNIDKAKQLLTAAGYPNGFKTSLIASPTNTNKDVLTAIQATFAQAGITLDLNMMDFGATNTYAQKGWNSALLALGKSVDSNMVYALISNWAQTAPWYVSVDKTNDFQKLIDAAAASKDFDPALAQKCLQYMYDNAMITPVYVLTRGQVAQKYVTDTGLYTLHNWPWWTPGNIWLNK
jgi:peptide/nickel transport system substrate-binding protein